MVFEISRDELLEMARIEEEAGCDVEAGFDWGRSAGAYLVSAQNYIDREKLLLLLQEGLSTLLDAEAIDAIATELQNHTKDLVVEKLQSAESA
ncbi:MAG: hypothetical protein ACFBSF_10060 [Leptolyngbyaceae cyanobacterium]